MFLVVVVVGSRLFLVVVVVVVVGSWLFLVIVFTKIFSCSCESFCPRLLPVTSLTDDRVEKSE